MKLSVRGIKTSYFELVKQLYMTLPDFLTTWDEHSLAAHRGIKLFDPEKSKCHGREVLDILYKDFL